MVTIRMFLRRLLAWFCLCAPAFAQMHDGKELVQATLLADRDAVVPGQKFTAGLLLKMQPGWHTYWQYSGDSGMPTRIDWQLPPGFVAREIQWPIPEKIIEPGGLWTYAYRDEVLLLVEITPPAQLAQKSITLTAHARWLVCEKICVPGDANLTLTLPVQPAANPAHEEFFSKARVRFPREIAADPARHLRWTREGADLILDSSGALLSAPVDFFPLPPEAAVVGHPSIDSTIANTPRIRIPITSAWPPRGQLPGILVTAAGEHWKVAPLSDSVPTPALTARRSLSGFLLFGFLGGLILNVMPCVLPVIALKVFGFIKQAGESPAKIFRLGLAFVAGIFAWFLALAALVVAFKLAGHELNWAFQFQHPLFLMAMIAVIAAFALNLLGVFEIVLPGGAQSRLASLSAREGYGGTFLHGVFATLMATPCTAPFLGPALGFAFAQPAPIVFAMFAAIAAGMSAPYFLFALNPGWLRFLPKPGIWMVRVKQAMGVLMLGTVLWLGWVLHQQKSVTREAFAPKLESALQQGRPVFVDFTADWCVNCKVNEKLVLNTESVQRAFREKNVIFLQADWTNGDPDITKLLRQFGRAGVPLYVFYPTHRDPIVLPEVITAKIVLDSLGNE